ncbi:hypothetical protein ACLOJK_004545 [Asimina triloba]
MQAKIFHYGSISLIEEPCRSTQFAAMNMAKRSGSILSYDPNLRLPLWPSASDAMEGIMSIWDQADIIKISEEEITFLTGGCDADNDDVIFQKLFHSNLKLLLVSEGSRGCRYYTKQFHGKVGGIKVKAVDATGAGDAFVAGFLSNVACDPDLLMDEKKMRRALRFANVCGALTVTKRGAIPALPTRDAVLQALPKDAAPKMPSMLSIEKEGTGTTGWSFMFFTSNHKSLLQHESGRLGSLAAGSRTLEYKAE